MLARTGRARLSQLRPGWDANGAGALGQTRPTFMCRGTTKFHCIRYGVTNRVTDVTKLVTHEKSLTMGPQSTVGSQDHGLRDNDEGPEQENMWDYPGIPGLARFIGGLGDELGY